MVSMADRKSEWICRHCEVKVTLFVTPSSPPTHSCKKKANQEIQLVKQEGTR